MFKRIFLLSFCSLIIFLLPNLLPLKAQTASTTTVNPDIKILDVNIDPATKNINVTIINNGDSFAYEKTVYIHAQDKDTGKKFVKMLYGALKGKEKVETLSDAWFVQETSSQVQNRDNGIYNIKVWLVNNAKEESFEKTIDINKQTAVSKDLDIFNVNVKNDGDETIISWETNLESTAELRIFNRDGAEKISINEKKKIHSIRKKLKPFTTYSHQITAYADGQTEGNGTGSFTTSGSVAIDMPDLIIKKVQFSPRKPKYLEPFQGSLNITVQNIGKAEAKGKIKIPLAVMIEEKSRHSYKLEFDSLGAGKELELKIDLNDFIFKQENNVLTIWLDSMNAGYGLNNEPKNENWAIDESDETNNSFVGKYLCDGSSDGIIIGSGSTKIKIKTDTGKKLKGKILLKVEDAGMAYYLNPKDDTMYYLGKPHDAFEIMRRQGVGITNANLEKIEIGSFDIGGLDTDKDGLADSFEDAIGTDKNKTDSDGDGHKDKDELKNGYSPTLKNKKQNTDASMGNKQKGMIFLQTEKNGEAWYINPNNGKRYFLGRPADAFKVMRDLGLGISNTDFSKL